MNLKQFVLKVWKLRDALPKQDHDKFFDDIIVKNKASLSSWTKYYDLWLGAGQPSLKEWDQKESSAGKFIPKKIAIQNIRFINR